MDSLRDYEEEVDFQRWYAINAKKFGLNPDPDAPEHYYDYRAAYKAGEGPGPDGHWPSKYKREGHPRMMVDGINTKTGLRSVPMGPNYEQQSAIREGTPMDIPDTNGRFMVEKPIYIRPNVAYPIGKYKHGLPYPI